MRTGPQRYPGASTAYWYQDDYPGSPMETNVILWHSTEGTSLPSYGGGASAPNLTAKPDFGAKRLRWYQHFDFDTSSRALRNQPGGVETNTLNVCQVEIVGTCDPATHRRWGTAPHLYMPNLPSWVIRDLGAFARWAHQSHGVPLTSGLTFKPYPSSYGANGVRMSRAQWTAFKGHCGHQHAPENDHGDPGAFPMAAILAAAKGETMDLTRANLRAIAVAVLTEDGIIDNPNPATADDNPYISLETFARNAEIILRRMERKLAALQPVELTDAQVAALADRLVSHPGFADALADKLADKLAQRLSS
ncbi:hypothetical protein [Streptomyces sp. enrichment culture]|uniref:hypothetical protein n=1 Tax=Streptomyces sp. enrichment culture TaxID=1795815 RepID=UPI003F57C8F4